MATINISKEDENKLNFMYGNAWKENPSIYLHSIHANDIVRHCEYCGRPMTESDVNDYGSLCEDCYRKEYEYDE